MTYLRGLTLFSLVPVAASLFCCDPALASSRPRPRTTEAWMKVVSEVLENPSEGLRIDWDFAVVEFTVTSQEVGDRTGMWPTYTWVMVEDVVVHLGPASPQEERMFVRVFALHSASQGLLFGGITMPDLWLEDGDRVLALVAKPKPSLIERYSVQDLSHMHHWEIQHAAQVREGLLFVVTDVTPAPSDGLHRGQVAIPSEMKHVLSERRFSNGAKYRSTLDSLLGGEVH